MLKVLFCTTGGYDEGKLYDRLARTSPRLATVSGKRITSIGLRALGWMSGATLTTRHFNKIDVNENDLLLLSQHCPLLKDLSLGMTSSNLPSDLIWVDMLEAPKHYSVVQAVVRHCPNLETLTLNEWSITYALAEAVASLVYLRSLRLHRCYDFTWHVFFTSLASLDLECLVLEYAQSFANNLTIQSIAHSFPNLKTFSLINTVLDDVSAASIDLLIRSCEYLEEFCVSSRKLNSNNSPLSDTTLCLLSKHCPLIKRVELGGTFSDAALVAFTKATPDLRELVVETLTETSIKALTKYCPKLEKLHATTVEAPGASMCRLFQSCRQLSDLSMNKATKATLSCLAHKCPKLTNLQLSGTDDDAVSALVWSRWLQSLHLSDLTSVRATGLLKVIKGCTRLRKLTVDAHFPFAIILSIPSIFKHIPRNRHYQATISTTAVSEDPNIESVTLPAVYCDGLVRFVLAVFSTIITTTCTALLYRLRRR